MLLVVSARRGPAAAVEETQQHPILPADLACRELVRLATDYLDGDLPPDWRRGVEGHLAECDGCTEYLRQIRAVIDAVEQLAAQERSTSGRGGH